MHSLERKLTYLGFSGYVFIGTAAVLVPSVMPSITDEYSATGISLAAIGLIFPARSLGGILGNLLSGVASDLVGRQRLVWLSALLLAISLALTSFAKPWILFLTAFALVSATQGAISTSINAMILEANRNSQARALNALHGIYGVGAMLSPLLIGYLLEQGMTWRLAFGGTGLIWLVYGVIAYRLMEDVTAHAATASDQKVALHMIRQVPFLSLALISFIYNGVAYSLLGWIAIFMQQTAGFSLFSSIAMISVFYVALTAGRFLCAYYTERIGYALTLLILSIGITVTYPLVVWGLSSTLAVAGVFLTGLGLSGLFPTALAYGSRLYPDQSGTLTGTLNVAMTLGAMIPPLWTGVIADLWNFEIALGINYLMVIPLSIIALYLRGVESTA